MTKVHAYAAPGASQPLEKFVYEANDPQSYEVEVKITHCGVCHSDLNVIDGNWVDYPCVAGHEIVGTISRCGANVDWLEVGQRVGIGWQASSCLACEWCIRGEENLCPNQTLTCVGHYGGFADTIIADSRFVYPIPDEIPSEQAAPLLCAGLTVYSPLRDYSVSSESRVGVIGIGGLGHLALQFARAFGCEVTAFSTTPDKEAEAKRFGAHRFILSTDAEQMESTRYTLDFILCTVNANLNWRPFLKALRPNGMLCLVGVIAGELRIPAMPLIGNQKSVRGSFIGSRSTMHEMLIFAARHHITSQIELLPMSDVNIALEKVRNNQARYRMVLEVEAEPEESENDLSEISEPEAIPDAAENGNEELEESGE